MIKNEELANELLNSINTLHESTQELYHLYETKQFLPFIEISNLFLKMIHDISQIIVSLVKEDAFFEELHKGIVLNIIYTIELILSYERTRSPKALDKIEFQLLPLVLELYTNTYYLTLIKGDKEKERAFDEGDYKTLRANQYIEDSAVTGEYKYDVSIHITAYNKLEYTKACVEAVIKYTPPHINYELILVNHGCTDGTKEYFESIGCIKQLDFKHNNLKAMPILSVFRILEGKYHCSISNDVLVCENYLDNMITIMETDPDVRIIVPTTTNIANLQTIPHQFSNMEEMFAFAKKNNVSDPFRWEVRTRLMNPIQFTRSSDMFTANGIGMTPWSVRGVGFNDDVQGLIYRRSGGKCILAKDTFCYHFGSVTLKEDTEYLSNQNFTQRRKDIKAYYGIDPWGTGFCYDVELFKTLECTNNGSVSILGINCGMGSNPLKIQENIKENVHNLDCTIQNITDAPEYAPDLNGVSDFVNIIKTENNIFTALSAKQYDYIVFEDPFQISINQKKLADTLVASLSDSGCLIVSTQSNSRAFIKGKITLWKTIKNWAIFRKSES